MAGEYELDPGTQIGEDGLRGSSLREQPPATRIGRSVGALTLPIYHQVALGLHPSILHISKFGKNPDIDTTTTPEDCWDGGGEYTGFSAAAETLSVVSTSTADDVGSTGATSVTIQGLDVNGVIQEETVAMDGQTPVITTKSFLRAYRAFVATAGTGSENAGVITATQTTSGDVMINIDATHGQTAQAVYTVPTGYTGLLIFTHILTGRINGSPGSAEVDLKIRPPGGAWRSIQNHFTVTGGPIVFEHTFPNYLESLTDLKIHVHEVSDNNTSISATFDILLIPDELL